MRRLRDIPIKWKLTIILMVTSSIVLVLACAAFLVYEGISYGRWKASNLETLADMIGANTASSLIFSDPTAASETLKALSAEKHMVFACIYTADGKVFATYRRGDAKPLSFKPVADGKPMNRLRDNRLQVHRRIMFNDERVGSIYIESDLEEIFTRIRQYIGIVLFFMLASSLVALFVSSKVRGVIATPILRLAQTAKTVSTGKDYSLRAVKHGKDEIGFLIDSFNDMLMQIQKRDAALQEAQDELERRVESRTAELQQEIAVRKKAEEALQLTQFSVDFAAVGILWTNRDGRILHANEAACSSLAYLRDELLSMSIFDFDSAYTPDTWDDSWAALRAEGSTTYESTYKDKNGVEYPFETTMNFLEFNGEEYNFVFVRNIEQRKKFEAELHAAKENAEAASRAKSEFLANMSHEIRTPMNGIIGMTGLALDTDLTAEQRDYLDSVRVSADSLLGVINDILDFSKIEAGRFALDPTEFNVRESVEETVTTLALRAHEKGLELACHILPDVPDAVIGDSRRLRQVIVNLIGNAIKFTEAGEVVLRVELEYLEKKSAVLHCSVADTGIGVPENQQGIIFDAFAQGDGSTTRRYGGTGLGLAISTQLVEMMGGRIWVDSAEGEGSTFHFTVSVGLPDESAVAARAHAEKRISLKGLSMLVVDDNDTNRRILKDLLTNWEIKATVVESAKQAIIAMEKEQEAGYSFDIVLVDAQMPDVDGFMLIDEIRRTPHLEKATIMMLSSADQRGDAARCRESGVTAYLTKPVRQSDLFDAIANAVNGKALGGDESLSVAETAGQTGERSSLRVLVAEDNAVNQKLAALLLEKLGHSVVMVNNGADAVERRKSDEFDIVLMDVQMPKMDGFEATAAIKELDAAEQKHTPIIAMTAHAMRGDRERCLSAGMDDYIAKPIKVDELVAALRRQAPTKRADAEALSSRDVMNMTDAMARVDGDASLLRELAEIFLETNPADMEQIRTAITVNDAVALAAASHKVKGSVGIFAAGAAFETALKLEMIGRDGDLSEAGKCFAELQVEISKLSQALAMLGLEEAA